MERTLVLIKPDGVQRGLIGEIISRFERRGLRLVAMKFMQISRELAERHYAEHEGKPFYPGLLDYITSGPVVAMVWEGPNAISVVRATMGATRPFEAAPGTIRADFALETGRNIVHGSANAEDAAREVDLFFEPGEIIDWTRDVDRWVLE
ncbi:MAG: nucleoside-diphosphate kinase [Aggregatilineales bacterium]|nr:nucleoside-diphosphate kinase [Chloroflexota bacterium]HOA22367.1 nucleoside-diphosphate kinase [Aggregatilineales bacterium]HPV06578.1 nucleoside-diphosphate kinase [Aggregatilineales bacterium]HQE17612.1 nucleoside-diphosphate kinase [Aggregatilineales bacterium]